MTLALALTFVAVILFVIVVGSIPVLMIIKGMGFRPVYITREEPPPVIIPGTVEQDTPEDVFFDQHDLAAAEAHEERKEFVHTTVLLNGVETGPDGTVPAEKRGTWFRR
jgi:hypothetical protein